MTASSQLRGRVLIRSTSLSSSLASSEILPGSCHLPTPPLRCVSPMPHIKGRKHQGVTWGKGTENLCLVCCLARMKLKVMIWDLLYCIGWLTSLFNSNSFSLCLRRGGIYRICRIYILIAFSSFLSGVVLLSPHPFVAFLHRGTESRKKFSYLVHLYTSKTALCLCCPNSYWLECFGFSHS